jgi:hypothetical protein
LPYFIGIKLSNIEYFTKLRHQRFTSLSEDFKAEQKQYLEDEKRNALKMAGKLEEEPVELTYERFNSE